MGRESENRFRLGLKLVHPRVLENDLAPEDHERLKTLRAVFAISFFRKFIDDTGLTGEDVHAVDYAKAICKGFYIERDRMAEKISSGPARDLFLETDLADVILLIEEERKKMEDSYLAVMNLYSLSKLLAEAGLMELESNRILYQKSEHERIKQTLHLISKSA